MIRAVWFDGTWTWVQDDDRRPWRASRGNTVARYIGWIGRAR